MAVEISHGRFASLEKIGYRIRASLQKEIPPPVVEDEDEREPVADMLALTPITKPTSKDAELLYKIAYEENFENHPLQSVTEALIVHGGILSPEAAENLDTPNSDLSGMITVTGEGEVFSEAIVREYHVQAQMHDVFITRPKELPHDNPSLTAIKVTHFAAD